MWKPWVGEDYINRRLLLLGESAYGWKEDGQTVHPTEEHAISVVQRAMSEPVGWSRFFTMVTRALCNQVNPEPATATAAWHTVAFVNYVDGSVGDTARMRPSREQWRAALKNWRLRLEELRPQTVIVLGKSLWRLMPPTDLVTSREDVQGYTLPDGWGTICWSSRHPAGGQSWQRLAKLIDDAEKHPIAAYSR